MQRRSWPKRAWRSIRVAQRQAAARRIAGGRSLARIAQATRRRRARKLHLWVLWRPLTRGGRGDAPRAIRKIPNLFNAGKPQTPANGAYLFRPSALQSSDRDAQAGMFESEVLARRHARFGGAVSRPWRSAARPALSAWPAWHPPRPARSSSAQGTV